jgi:hypothetical protein
MSLLHCLHSTMRGLRREVIANLDAHWIGTMTSEMCQLLQRSCGLSQTHLVIAVTGPD